MAGWDRLGHLASEPSEASTSSAGSSPTRNGEGDAKSRSRAVEPSFRIMNLRAKLSVLSKEAHRMKGFNAIAELIDEAKFNKASLVDEEQAAQEVAKLLAMPAGARKAVSYRDLTEFGRPMELPRWHGTDRRHSFVWYSCMQRLRLVEVEEGQEVVRGGEEGEMCYWMLEGSAHSTGPRAAGQKLLPFARIGAEALQAEPYTVTVTAVSKLQLAGLHRDDYCAVVAAANRESFENLKAMHLLSRPRAQRLPQEVSELSSMMSVTELFRAMDPALRDQVCNLLEYLAVPEGSTLFDEGDRTDFCYVILKGQAVFTRHNEARNVKEEIAVKSTGEHFGTLATLGGGEKRRPIGARALEACEFAIISRSAYARLVKAQLQRSIDGRMELLRRLSVMQGASVHHLQKVATSCQDEVFPAGTTLIDPACPPLKLFIVADGEVKLLWMPDAPHQVPPSVDRPLGAAAGTIAGGAGAPTAASAAITAADSAISGQLGVGYAATAGGGVAGGAHPARPRRRGTAVEVALLSRGDVLNGAALQGRATCFHAVAATQLRVLTLELSGIEQILGKDQIAELKVVVEQQTEGHRQRVAQTMAVRQNSEHLWTDDRPTAPPPAQMGSNFLQHYVPPSHAVSAASAAAAAAKTTATAAVAAGAAGTISTPAPAVPPVPGGRARGDVLLLLGQHFGSSGLAAAPVTTIVAAVEPVRRTRMRSPSPAMAHALGLQAPPMPSVSPGSVRSKSRNGKPAAKRPDYGLPFAGTLALAVLENQADMLRIIPSVPSAGALGGSSSTGNGSYSYAPGLQQLSLEPSLPSMPHTTATMTATAITTSSSTGDATAVVAAACGAGVADADGSSSSLPPPALGPEPSRGTLADAEVCRIMNSRGEPRPAAPAAGAGAADATAADTATAVDAPPLPCSSAICLGGAGPSSLALGRWSAASPGPGSIMLAEPLTLAASAKAAVGGSPSVLGTHKSACSPGPPPLAAGQHHAPIQHPHLRLHNPAAAANPPPVLSSPGFVAAALVQSAASPTTAKMTVNRAATVVSGYTLEHRARANGHTDMAAGADGGAGGGTGPATGAGSGGSMAAAGLSPGGSLSCQHPGDAVPRSTNCAATTGDPTAAALAPAPSPNKPAADMVLILPKMMSVYDGALFEGSYVTGVMSTSPRSPVRHRYGPSASVGGGAHSAIASPSPGPGGSSSPAPHYRNQRRRHTSSASLPHLQGGYPTDGGAGVAAAAAAHAHGGAYGTQALPAIHRASTEYAPGMAGYGGGGRRRGGARANSGTDGAGAGVASLRDLAGVDLSPRTLFRKSAQMALAGSMMRRADEPLLPLEADRTAPPMMDRQLSCPTQDDVVYILQRWTNRWAEERALIRKGTGGQESAPTTTHDEASAPGTLSEAAKQAPAMMMTMHMEPPPAAEGRERSSVAMARYGHTQHDRHGGGSPNAAAAAAAAVAGGAGSGSSCGMSGGGGGGSTFARDPDSLGEYGTPFRGGTPRAAQQRRHPRQQ